MRALFEWVLWINLSLSFFGHVMSPHVLVYMSFPVYLCFLGVISTTYGAVLDSQKQKRIKRCSRGWDLNIMWKQERERSLETLASGEKTRDKQSNYALLRFFQYYTLFLFPSVTFIINGTLWILHTSETSSQADKQSNYALLRLSKGYEEHGKLYFFSSLVPP